MDGSRARLVCVLTGSRSEYGILRPVMNKINLYPELRLTVIAAGMHLEREFGRSLQHIKEDGFPVGALVQMTAKDDSLAEMAGSVGRGIIGIVEALEKIHPEFLVVLGDRLEVLAGAIAAAYLNIPVAHIHGGELTQGGLDESARHAVTRFAHLHLAATKKSAENLRRMGEENWRIHLVGSPAIDAILSTKLLSTAELESKLQIDLSRPLVLVVQHPVTTQVQEAERQMEETLSAVAMTGHKAVVIYPNADAGGRRMIKVIRRYQERHGLKAFANLTSRVYLSLLKHASVLVGNSSSGLIEAPSFGIPAVNIGIRQEGRERAENVIDVPKHDRKAILAALGKALGDQKFRLRARQSKNPYGDGQAAERIAEVLVATKIDFRLLQKKLSL
jgi:UDP-N-acetylglucosamine 2-epimerase (non-hydrolysing)/GDP/UDP-N,N'-diacetylbacillosamine 2-epimerase (hydrolysing)